LCRFNMFEGGGGKGEQEESRKVDDSRRGLIANRARRGDMSMDRRKGRQRNGAKNQEPGVPSGRDVGSKEGGKRE